MSQIVKKINVDIRRLDTVLKSLNIDRIDILSIDVEGWELEVMQGLDTKSINCEIIVVENFLHSDSYNAYFQQIGYYLSHKVEYNYIYMKVA